MQDNKPQIIPQVSIHPDRINVYSTVEYPFFRPTHENSLHNLSGHHQNFGRLSMQASRKLTKAADYLCYMATPKEQTNRWNGKACKFRLTFVTLTLSSAQIHSDVTIKALFLNQFLTEAKQRWHVSRYVWRAEKQLNGNIHFHILTDRFIPWSELRDVWNRIQNKLGYVNRYRDNLRKFHAGGFHPRNDIIKFWPIQKQLKAYQFGCKTDWNNPNSTDIHNLRHVNNVKRYVAKYMSKNESERQRLVRIKFLQECLDEKINLSDEQLNEYVELSNYFNEGRIWGCSAELSKIKGGNDTIDSQIENELQIIQKSNLSKVYTGEHFQVIFIEVDNITSLNCPRLCQLFYGYLYEKFNYNKQLTVATGLTNNKKLVRIKK